MKKLHYIFPIIAMLFCNVAMATTNYSDVLYATNLVVWDYNNLPSGRIGMYHGIINLPFNADIGSSASELEVYGTNDIRIYTISDPTAVIHLETGGGGVSVEGGSLTVQGNITATGWVSAATNILWQTNIVWSTNSVGSIYATNAPDNQLLASTNYVRTNLVQGTLINYATNAQTTTVDMSIPYGDVDVAGGITFAGLSNTKDTAYQTAVVFVKNTTGVVAPIAFPTEWTNTAGALRVTNYTICTIVRNPGRFTNIVTLPVW